MWIEKLIFSRWDRSLLKNIRCPTIIQLIILFFSLETTAPQINNKQLYKNLLRLFKKNFAFLSAIYKSKAKFVRSRQSPRFDVPYICSNRANESGNTKCGWVAWICGSLAKIISHPTDSFQLSGLNRNDYSPIFFASKIQKFFLIFKYPIIWNRNSRGIRLISMLSAFII